jgi:hypothetical protein
MIAADKKTPPNERFKGRGLQLSKRVPLEGETHRESYHPVYREQSLDL